MAAIVRVWESVGTARWGRTRPVWVGGKGGGRTDHVRFRELRLRLLSCRGGVVSLPRSRLAGGRTRRARFAAWQPNL